MDDIRLAVVDAFFSLPRGGAEIGGILLGRHADDKVTIGEYVPIDCEHATGPSFVLSERDEAELEKLLARAKEDFPGLQPVGWYHSHTRSEIFLSEADIAIHHRFFPEPWSVALVLKPHTFQPMRCGFFFREADGSVHASECYQEFTLDALPLLTIPTGDVPAVPETGMPVPQGDLGASGTVIEVPASTAVEPEPELPREEPPSATEVPLPLHSPSFTLASEQKPRPWMKIAVGVFLALGLSAAGFQVGHNWLPRVMASGENKPAIASPARPLALSTLDNDGQLQIRWDRSTSAVLEGTAAILTIHDDTSTPRIIRLDQDHLRSGSFTYVREGGHVDVTFTIERSGTTMDKAATTFMGSPVKGRASNGEVARLRQQLATESDQRQKVEKQLADQSTVVSQAGKMSERVQKLEKTLHDVQVQAADVPKLRNDLAAANDRNKKLAKDLAEAQAELKQQQRRRLGNQDSSK